MIPKRLLQIQSGSSLPSGGFSPFQLSGLKLWLKSDTGVTVDGSGKVSNWADQSGNAKDIFQADPAKRPDYISTTAYNLSPAVSFPATGDYWLQTANSDITASHIFIAYEPKSLTSDCRILGFANADNTSASYLLATSPTLTGKMQFYPSINGSWSSTTIGPSLSSLNKVSFYNDSTTSNLRINDSVYSESKNSGFAVNNIATNKYFHLSRKFLGSYGGTLNGLVLEVIVTDQVNSSYVQGIFDYFSSKYQP